MRKKGVAFPPRKEVVVVYEEKGVSGRSHKSLLTKVGGGKNCIIVTVTNSELWINVMFPFNIVAYYYDSLHRLPLSVIKKATQSGKSVIVEFNRPDGSNGVFELLLKNPDEFIRALQGPI